jgi:hypothetical protein
MEKPILLTSRRFLAALPLASYIDIRGFANMLASSKQQGHNTARRRSWCREDHG